MPKSETAPNKNIPDSILEQATDIALHVWKQSLSKWRKDLRAQLIRFLAIKKDCLDKLAEASKKKCHYNEFAEIVESNIHELNEWVQENINFQVFSIEDMISIWRERFAAIIEETPSTYRSAISKKYCSKNADDILEVAFWKHYKRTQIAVTEKCLALTNIFRKLFGITEATLRVQRRSIKAKYFLKYYCEFPIAEILLQSWSGFLQTSAGLHNHIHTNSEELIRDVLEILEKIEASPEAIPYDDILSRIKNAYIVSSELESFNKELSELNTASTVALSEELEDLSEDTLQNWELAGTALFPNTRFNDKKIAKTTESFNDELAKTKTSWDNHFQIECEDFIKDIDLATVQFRVLNFCNQTIDGVTAKIDDQILPCFNEPKKVVASSFKAFQENLSEQSELREKILLENRSTLRILRRELLPQIIDTFTGVQLIKTLDNYLSRVTHEIEKLPEKQKIFRHCDLKNLPPESTSVDISLKDLVTEEIIPKLSNEYKKFMAEVQVLVDKVARDISEIDQIIEFNLDAALELLEKSETKENSHEAQQVVIEGLDRATSRLADLVLQNEKIRDLSTEKLLEISLEFRHSMQALASNEKIFELQLRAAKAQTQEEIRKYRTRIYEQIKAALPTFFRIVTNVAGRVKNNYQRLRRITGMEPLPDVEQELTQFLSETRKQLSALPFVYQRLFRFEPLDDDRFFSGRQKELESLSEKFELWKNGNYGTTAVVGEKGSGRTTLMNHACREIYKGFPLRRFDLVAAISSEKELFEKLKSVFMIEDAGNFTDLETKIAEAETKVIGLVENLHRMFLRTMNGFAAMERFLLFVANTHKKVCWLVTSGLYGWNYLDKVLELSKFFQSVLFMKELSIKDIENIILKRHRVSGYKLIFQTPVEIAEKRKFKKLKNPELQQEFLREMFFEQLNKLAAGNIMVAFLFWLCAVEEIREDALFIHPVIDFDSSFLQKLPADELFTFAAFLQHETLTEAQHASIFSQPLSRSQLIVTRMYNRGILASTENGFQIHHLLYRPIVRTLKLNNIVH